jgi:electron transfer flavoprotein beta subunit
MLNIIVCIKQVPMVSELPWNSKTGTLRREAAQGMMDPASRRALEAALQIKAVRPACIHTVAMGPPMAAEVLYEAKALGADSGILLTDRKMAGADTYLTSFILGKLIRRDFPDFQLIICGSQTSDSETGQVGPQLAEELGIPDIGYARSLTVGEGTVAVERHVDDFYEVLEMDLPGLVTIDLAAYRPRYASLEGLQSAFETADIRTLDADALGLDNEFNALRDSPTRILDVYSPTSRKENRVLKGAVKKVVDELLADYGKIISGAMGKDLGTHGHDEV